MSAAYTLYFFHPRSREVVRSEQVEAESDEAAIDAVKSYRGSRTVELWRGSTKVHCIEAIDLASRLVALGSLRTQEDRPTPPSPVGI